MNASAHKVLRPAISKPWWRVRRDAQVGLHLDCGTPRLEMDGTRQRRVVPRGAKILVVRCFVHSTREIDPPPDSLVPPSRDGREIVVESLDWHSCVIVALRRSLR